MTSPAGSTRAAPSSNLPSLQLLGALLLVLGLNSPGVSACGGAAAGAAAATAAAKDPLAKTSEEPTATTPGGGRATDAAPAAVATTLEWPEGMSGVWTGEYLAGSDQTDITEGMSVMLFITPDAAANVALAFSGADPDAIETAMISENTGIEPRDEHAEHDAAKMKMDGGGHSYVWLNRAVATTEDGAPGATFGGATRCISFTLDGDTMYVLAKGVDDESTTASTDKFEACPAAPVAADFTADIDLAALDADFAIVLKRTPEDARVKWPAGYPGQWKGAVLGASSAIGNKASPSNAVPIYNVVVQGVALNAWLYADAEDAAKILGANVGKVESISSEAWGSLTWANGISSETEGESHSFVNEPFKYTAGDDTPTGGERWLNRFIIDEDDEKVYFLSVAEGETTPDTLAAASLKVPDPALLAEALIAQDFAPLADTGASAGFVMKKV